MKLKLKYWYDMILLFTGQPSGGYTKYTWVAITTLQLFIHTGESGFDYTLQLQVYESYKYLPEF